MQTLLVIIIVVAAGGYLFRRLIKQGPGGSCGCSCSTSCSSKEKCALVQEGQQHADGFKQ